jgi:uncharacterized protein (TIGR00369 family)
MAGRRTRTVDFEEPSATSSAALGKPGIEFLRALSAGRVPAPPLHVTLGFSLCEVDDGFARYELVPGEHLYGAHNAVHSGVMSALLDAVMSAAVTTTLDASTTFSLATLTTHVTRSISSRTAKVLAEGWVVHRGSRLVTAEAKLTDDQGRLLAHGSATCALSERPGGGS